MQGNITDWGKEVKKGLIERGWSINDLAERIGKSRTRVSGVVNGRIYSDSIASAISDLLNIEKASASMKEATRDWCMDARKAMIDLDMNTGELADKTGYCKHECPICSYLPVATEAKGLEGITLRLMKRLDCDELNRIKKELVDITEDGIIDETEKPELKKILAFLDEVAESISELKIVGEKYLKKV